MIDTHHHLWKLENGYYNWLTKDLKPIYKDFDLKDYEAIIKDFDVHSSIVVQAAAKVQETFYLLDIAKNSTLIKGVIGWVELLSDHVLTNIDELNQQPLFKGIRPMLQNIPQSNWILNPNFDLIFKKLIQKELIFEALIRPIHIEHIITLAKNYPNLKIVINHGAKPTIKHHLSKDDEDFEHWKTSMTQAAEYENIFCKLSGLVTEVKGKVNFEALYPYMSHIIEVFGTKRVFFGSDYPVINLASSYSNWFTIVQEFLRNFTESERQNILEKNAQKFYKID